MTTHTLTILDGGMSRELARIGAPFQQPEWSALAIIEAPEKVTQAHNNFIQSGANIITTNSYALVPFHIGEERFAQSAKSLAATAGQAAKDAVIQNNIGTKIAASLPPMFGSYRPDLYQADQLSRIATPLIEGLAPYADLWLIETQSLIQEALDINTLINQICNNQKPVWVAFTLEDEQPSNQATLRSGESVKDAVTAMLNAKVTGILFNCCQPEVIGHALTVTLDVLKDLQAEHVQIGAYANAFAPQTKEATANEGLDEVREDLTPLSYLEWAKKWHQQGATLIGGCCGIGPEHIAQLNHHFAPLKG